MREVKKVSFELYGFMCEKEMLLRATMSVS